MYYGRAAAQLNVIINNLCVVLTYYFTCSSLILPSWIIFWISCSGYIHEVECLPCSSLHSTRVRLKHDPLRFSQFAFSTSTYSASVSAVTHRSAYVCIALSTAFTTFASSCLSVIGLLVACSCTTLRMLALLKQIFFPHWQVSH